MATQAASPAIIPDRAAGHDPAVEAQCRQLREQLGAFGYQWLCATAVYPKLRFPLSTYLGAVVAAGLGRAPPNEDDQFALFRLPWFRHGWIPEELRLALIADLDPRLATAVRAAIERTLYSATIADTDPDASGPVPLAEPPLRWRAMLHAYWEAASPDAPERDRIFNRYMSGRPVTATAIDRTKRLERLLGPQLHALLQHGRPLLAIAALASIAAALTADSWLRPSFERQRQVAIPVDQAVAEEPAREPESELPVSPKPDSERAPKDPLIVGGSTPPVTTRPPAGEAELPVSPKAGPGRVPSNGPDDINAAADDSLPPDCQFSPYSTCGLSSAPPATTSVTAGPDGSRSVEQRGTDPMAAYREAQKIQSVQRALSREGYEGPADGILGRLTVEAIRRYQQRMGLPVTGKIDDELLKSLGDSPTGRE